LNSTGSKYLISTLLGGSDDDEGFGIAVDGSGNGYIVGTTHSKDFPTTKGALQTKFPSSGSSGFSAFITKFNSGGTGLVFSTYLGGNGSGTGGGGDQGFDIALDPFNNVFVTGETSSTNFPLSADAQQTA